MNVDELSVVVELDVEKVVLVRGAVMRKEELKPLRVPLPAKYGRLSVVAPVKVVPDSIEVNARYDQMAHAV